MSTSINPETLKYFRKRSNFSQQGLADESGVSKKTIARIEGGQASVNTTTAKRLAKVFNASHSDLAKPLRKKGEGEQALNAIGYQRINPYIHENAWLAMQMVERIYGIKPQVQFTMAPLFAALLAEGSLAWRRRKLAAAEEAARTLDTVDYGHLGFREGAARVDEMAAAESESIEHRDIFGEKTLEHSPELGLAMFPVNPFVEYLSHLTRERGRDLINVLPGARYDDEEYPDGKWLATSFNFPGAGVWFSIYADELDRLVGDNEWAGRALQWGCVRIADIPEELMGDDVREERVAWLEKQIPPAKRAEHEAYRDNLLHLFDKESEGTENEG